jgi:tetratricopeptide (TPR) repeat protein
MSTEEKTAATLLDAADAVFQQREYLRAREIYKETLKLAREEFNPSVEVEALSQIARTYVTQNQLAEAEPWLDEAAKRAKESDPIGWTRYLSVKGRVEWKSKNISAAQKTFDTMFTFSVDNDLQGRAVDAANMLSILSTDHDEQVNWLKKGIEMAEAGEVESWLGPLWNNLGVAYSDSGKINDALTCFEKARVYHWRHSDENAKLFADYHIGMTLRNLGRFDEAAKWLRPVLSWAQRIENHSAIAQTLEDLAEISIARGDTKSGLIDLKQAKEHFRLAGYEQNVPETWQRINNRITALER